MTERHPDDNELERFFAAERAAPAQPSAELLARVMADAQGALPRPVARPTIMQRLAGLVRDLGGWPTVAGLTAAGVAGLWIGIDPPPALRDNVAAIWAADDMDYLVYIAPEDPFSLEEGTTL